MENPINKEFKKTIRALMVLVVILTGALIVFITSNTKSPYLNPSKVEHLGQLTYKIPTNGKWVYGDLDTDSNRPLPGETANLAIDGDSGMIIEKGYIDLDSMTLFTVGYAYDGLNDFEKDQKVKDAETVKDLPKCIKNYKYTENDFRWKALFEVDNKKYCAEATCLYGVLDVGYDEFIRSINFNKNLKDEFESENNY